MEQDVKVRFPDGRVTQLPRKTAESREVVKMGGVILEEFVKVPKRFAPIVEEVAEVVGMATEDSTDYLIPKPRKKRGPNKKKKHDGN